jgi:hypothetical protein
LPFAWTTQSRLPRYVGGPDADPAGGYGAGGYGVGDAADSKTAEGPGGIIASSTHCRQFVLLGAWPVARLS